MHPHFIVYYYSTRQTAQTQNSDEDSFDMLYKNNLRAAIPDSIWTTNTIWKKINILSFTDNNVMIFLFDFEKFRIESRIPPSYLILLTMCL